ncbi:YkgJ family cysteine cluster protein [Oceanicoccus sp. KOV_DT_Chl]|uniref:YkgJ family cysteine cluster protein n=1 Tax=Oceanicoccus sp. KOV_DT_Chl TaxID=1904639 RepID=UPI000C7B80CB|nr:YkgJ family cysteine cluster protein [Oceanicoccus sp. KOV_DT_Chl]
MDCRNGCGACCIATSITLPLPGMPEGKPAGVVCINLDDDYRCQLFGTEERPALCEQFKAAPDVCGNDRTHALQLISALELATANY